jgi:hypothetical protein
VLLGMVMDVHMAIVEGRLWPEAWTIGRLVL